MSDISQTNQPMAPSNSITLYVDGDYKKEPKTFTEAVPRLSEHKRNDVVSSCVVTTGTWILYEDANYKGPSSVLVPGRYPHSKDMHIKNDELSSLRPLPTSQSNAIVLFEDTDYGGKMTCLTEAESKSKPGFNDRSLSLIVLSGTWQLFQHANCGGDSWIVSANGGPNEDGRYPTYKEFYSARPVDASLDFAISNGECNPSVEDVRRQVQKLSDNTVSYTIKGSIDNIEVTDHLQGMARSRDGEYIYLVHSYVGTMLICQFASRKIVQSFPMGITGYKHPGGIQQVGDLLIVPMANNEGRSKVVFYDLSRVSRDVPPVLLPVTILLDYCNAWSAGMTTWEHGGKLRHLVAIRGGMNVYFFESNGVSLHCPGAAFQRIGENTGQPILREYEALNLITDAAGTVYMAGFWSKGGDSPTHDYVDLLVLNPKTMKFSMVEDSHKIECKDSSVHFRWGAGLRIVSPTRIEAHAVARTFYWGDTKISIINPT